MFVVTSIGQSKSVTESIAAAGLTGYSWLAGQQGQARLKSRWSRYFPQIASELRSEILDFTCLFVWSVYLAQIDTFPQGNLRLGKMICVIFRHEQGDRWQGG